MRKYLCGQVVLYSVERRGGWLVAHAYVQSSRDRRVYYHVVLEKRIGSRYYLGRCSCPDYRYRGGPCKHILCVKEVLASRLKARLGR